jgi:hypothetical protein
MVSVCTCLRNSSRIGIAITTHQRADVLNELEQHMKHLPAGALVVIDDGSNLQR